MTQILTNQASTLTLTAYTAGTQTDQGTFTIGVVDGNGDSVVSSGTAVTDNSDGTYDYSLTAQSNVDQLTATWTESAGQPIYSTDVEVVGNFLFDEYSARTWGAKDNANVIPLNSSSEYSDARIAAERERVTTLLEEWTGRSWIPRYCRAEFIGTGTDTLWFVDGVPRLSTGRRLHRPGRLNDIGKLLSVTIGGTAQTLTDFEIDDITGRLYKTTGSFTAGTQSSRYNVVVEYEYGLPFIVDGVDAIAMDMAVDRLVTSSVLPGQSSMTDAYGNTVRFVTEGGRFGNKTRLPHVNQWIADHNTNFGV